MERLMTNAGVIITRLSPEHMFCLYCCYFRNCGEHMSTVDCCSLHAIPMINLPFPSLFVYVKLLGKHRHTHTNKTKQAHVHLLTLILLQKQNKITYFSYFVPQGCVKFYGHKKVTIIFIKPITKCIATYAFKGIVYFISTSKLIFSLLSKLYFHFFIIT